MGKVIPSASVKNEPAKLEAFVRKLEITKIGTEEKDITSLAEDANRCLPKINDETLEQKICSHKIDILQKNLVCRMIKWTQKQREYDNVFASRSCTSTGKPNAKQTLTKMHQF